MTCSGLLTPLPVFRSDISLRNGQNYPSIDQCFSIRNRPLVTCRAARNVSLVQMWTPAGLFLPCGSTSFASLRASELARSVLAGVTARIRQLSRVMNCMIMSLICCSMSAGWSPTGTLVIPGRSMRVRLSTATVDGAPCQRGRPDPRPGRGAHWQILP